MCGRFALSLLAARFPDVLGATAPEGYRPRWNIAPDGPILILRGGRPGREAVLARWGLLGPWMTDAGDRGRQINARLETAADKPMFKAAFAKGRCVVPADGFYEWQKQTRGPSRPFFVRSSDGSPLLMAGLWRRNRLSDGSLLESAANEFLLELVYGFAQASFAAQYALLDGVELGLPWIGDVLGQVGRLHHLLSRKHHCSFDYIFQLAHVPRPRVSKEQVEGFAGKGLLRYAEFA
jgi:hypothetical protein